MNHTSTVNGGRLLVDCLIAQGADRVFTVPGESFLAVLDALHDSPEVQTVICRQEGGAAFMACADGAMTGRPGVCFVTRGPGATNASIGVHTAFQDSTPMVLLVGDVASDTRDREAFQEMDFRVMFGPSALGMAKRVEPPAPAMMGTLPWHVSTAVRMMAGYSSPVSEKNSPVPPAANSALAPYGANHSRRSA